MVIQAYTNRGTGIECVHGSGPVVSSDGYMSILPDGELMISLRKGDQHQGQVYVSVREICTIVEFLRSNRIEVAPMRCRNVRAV
jgi:hypothetical protein